MDPGAVLADLDADQRRAVTTDSRLVAVIAGAGSGKTRVLTRRIAHRVATGSADAAHTAVLTFTREAAGELRRRLPRLGLTDRVTAGTFHSVAQGLLRQRWLDRDERPPMIVNDRTRIVRGIAGPDRIDELVAELDWATARGLGPAAYEAVVRRGERRPGVDTERVAEALASYVAEKRRRNIVDFDDLLTLTNEALTDDDEFAQVARWRFRHVLVDEAQDLNPLQHRFVDLLRQGQDDVFLVGDPAQAIYGFTGSDPTLLIDVAHRFPGIEIVRLPVNHRCTPQIVDAGTHVLRTGDPAQLRSTDLVSARPDGPLVATAGHEDEAAEATAIASAIARLDPTLVRSGSVAVLARTHAVLAPIRAALTAAGVAIRRNVQGSGSPYASLLDEAYRIKDSNRLRQWAYDVADEATGDDDPRRDVAQAAFDFLREQPTGDGAGLRTWVVTTDPFDGAAAGVELLTFHGAKGREWHTVHLAGCETSLVPHRSATTTAARAEEARLFYVALTRASDVVVVHWAARRLGYQRKPTPLLDGFESSAPRLLPPPSDLVGVQRSSRTVALERLRAWRDATARLGGILPDAVCTDHTLALIAEHRPSTPEELDRVTGLGAITSGRLFDGVRAALDDVDGLVEDGASISR